MNARFSILTCILLCVGFALRADILTGPVTNAANGHVYYLLTQGNWVTAEDEAKAMGGHLVTIDDAAEQLWVFSTFATYAGIYRSLWIGLNDIKVEGQFRWASGAPITYTNWNPTTPNGGTAENAVFMYPACTDMGKWDDVYALGAESAWCGPPAAPYNGVVEIDPLAVKIEVSQVAVRWNSALDVKYQVQFVEAPAGEAWKNLGAPVMGSGKEMTVLENVLGQEKRFYRVITVP